MTSGQRFVVDLTQIHGYEDFAVVDLRRGKRIRLTKARAASGESSGQITGKRLRVRFLSIKVKRIAKPPMIVQYRAYTFSFG